MRQAVLLACRERASSFTLGAVAGLLALVMVSLGSMASSARLAVDMSVTSDLAGKTHLYQGSDLATTMALDRQPELSVVLTRDRMVTTPTRRSTASVRTVRDERVHIGHVVRGERPTTGEVALYETLASSLEVGTGESVDLDGRMFRISGILVDPGDVGRLAAVAVDPSLVPDDSAVYLADAAPGQFPALAQSFETREITHRSLSWVTQDVRANEPELAKQLPAAAAGVGFGGLTVALLLAGAITLARARAIPGLVAAGLPASRAWRVVGLATALPLGMGLALGTVTACATLVAGMVPVSSHLGQRWVMVVPTVGPISAAGAVLLVLSVYVGEVIRLASSLMGPLVGFRLFWTRKWWWFVSAAAVGGATCLALAVLSRAFWPHIVLIRLAPWGAAALGVAIPLLAFQLLTARLPSALRALAHRVSNLYVVTGAIIGGLAATAAWAIGFTTLNTTMNISLGPHAQPPGSYAVHEIPAPLADELVRTYGELGGRSHLRFDLPKEADGTVLRVTSPGLSDCFARLGGEVNDLPQDCWPDSTASPINIITLAPSGTVRADPGLIVDGHVALLSLDTRSGRWGVESWVPAVPDSLMGGNLGGLTLPADSELATELGLGASEQQIVVLVDFGDLPPASRANLRSTIAVLSPASQTAEAAVDGGHLQELAMANTLSALVSVVILLQLVLTAVAANAAHRSTRRALADLNSTLKTRRMITASLVGPVAIGLIASWLLAMIAMRASVPAEATHAGYAWLLPGAVGLLGCGFAAASWWAIPPRAMD